MDIEQKAVSDFAKSRSLTEQRKFLPIYSVRAQLMRVIQDHQSNTHLLHQKLSLFESLYCFSYYFRAD